MDDTLSVVLPNSVTFEELDSELIYESSYENSLATVEYTYKGNSVGRTYLQIQDPAFSSFTFGETQTTPAAEASDVSEDAAVADTSEELSAKEASEEVSKKPVTNNDEDSIFINVKTIIIVLSCIAAAIVIFLVIRSVMRNYHFAKRRKAIMRRTRSKYKSSEFDKFKF